jgi:hypothetical protein
MKPEDDPNATLAQLIARAWELELRKRQREEAVTHSITALAVRQRIETLKRELGEAI